MNSYELRPVSLLDAQALAQIFNQPKVIYGTLRMPFTPDIGISGWIERCDRDTRMIVAEADGKAVGFVHLTRGKGRMSHLGDLFIAVHDKYHGRGIGKALMTAMLDIADNWMGLVRVQLEVLVPNETAIALYKSCGFQVEGRARAGTIADGALVDHFYMARLRPTLERRPEDGADNP